MIHLRHTAEPAHEPNGRNAPEETAERHARAVALASVRSEGAPALARLMLHVGPDHPAATLEMGALLRALPGVGPVGAADLLRLAHIRDRDALGALTAAERRRLSLVLAHAPYELGSNTLGTPGP
jgi:hypothetical protein